MVCFWILVKLQSFIVFINKTDSQKYLFKFLKVKGWLLNYNQFLRRTKKEETDKLRNKTSPAKNEFLLIKTLVTEQGNGILTDDKGPYSWLT